MRIAERRSRHRISVPTVGAAVTIGVGHAIALSGVEDPIVVVIGIGGIRGAITVEVEDRIGVQVVRNAIAVGIVIDRIAVAVVVFGHSVDAVAVIIDYVERTNL